MCIRDSYQSGADFAADLRRFLAGELVQARPTPWFVRGGRVAWRHRRWLMAAGALAMLGVSYGFMEARLGRALTTSVSLTPNQLARAGDPTIERAIADRLEPRTGNRLRSEPVDFLAPADVRLEEGQFRFRLEYSDGTWRELTREVRVDGESLRLTAPPPLPADFESTPMVSIEGGRFTNPQVVVFGAETRAGVELAPYLLDVHEVTNGQFREYVRRTGAPIPWTWEGLDWQQEDLSFTQASGQQVAFAEQPVNGVTYSQARGYSEWVGKRLPTYWELEFALRGSDWRPTASGEPMVAGETGVLWSPGFDLRRDPSTFVPLAQAALVAPTDDRGDRTPAGVVHLMGNASEWTDTWLGDTIDGRQTAISNRDKMILPGSFLSDDFKLDLSTGISSLGSVFKEEPFPNNGFRCAKSSFE